MPLSEAEITACLKTVIDPDTGKDYVSSQAGSRVRVRSGRDRDPARYPAKSSTSVSKRVAGRGRALPGGRVNVYHGAEDHSAHAVHRGVKLHAGCEEHHRGGERARAASASRRPR
jgi:ATP-binding protein involved in chromosome partitioning